MNASGFLLLLTTLLVPARSHKILPMKENDRNIFVSKIVLYFFKKITSGAIRRIQVEKGVKIHN